MRAEILDIIDDPRLSPVKKKQRIQYFEVQHPLEMEIDGNKALVQFACSQLVTTEVRGQDASDDTCREGDGGGGGDDD